MGLDLLLVHTCRVSVPQRLFFAGELPENQLEGCRFRVAIASASLFLIDLWAIV